MDVEWRTAADNSSGILKIGFTNLNEKSKRGRVVGYNGIVKGNKVSYEGDEFYVVMVSHLGVFGLSEINELPYEITALPKDVKLILN